MLRNINYKINSFYNNLSPASKILSFITLPLILIFIYFEFIAPYSFRLSQNLQNELRISEQKLAKLQQIKNQNVFEITKKIKLFAQTNEINVVSSVFENNILACEFEAEFENIKKMIEFAEKNRLKIEYFLLKESKNYNISLQMKVIL